jgi:hypothetical protein
VNGEVFVSTGTSYLEGWESVPEDPLYYNYTAQEGASPSPRMRKW